MRETVEKEIRELNSRLFFLGQGLFRRKCDKERAYREYQDALAAHQKAVDLLHGTYRDTCFPGDPSLEELAGKKKIIPGPHGAYVLSPAIRREPKESVRVGREYCTTTAFVRPEGDWHRMGVYRRPRLDGSSMAELEQMGEIPGIGAASETVREWYREREVTVAERDKAYDAAFHWVRSRYYGRYYPDVKRAWEHLASCRETYEGYRDRYEAYRQSGTCQREQAEIREIRREIEALSRRDA